MGRPLLSSMQLLSEVTHALYICWHTVTIVLAVVAVAYLSAPLEP